MTKQGRNIAVEFRAARSQLQVSQQEMAKMLGLSPKTVQSYEQGWRRPSRSILRLVYVLCATARAAQGEGKIACWKVKHCADEVRRQCRAYLFKVGNLCWLITGTKCSGKELHTLARKDEVCSRCMVYQRVVSGGRNSTRGNGK